MSSLLSTARSTATHWHADQKYGTEPYTVHLAAVESVLREFGHADNEELLAAAWLHDILEDTPATIADLVVREIPPYVIALVDAVTDQPGKNRAERHALTYPRIARIPDAVTLKLSDRLVNIRASVERRPDLLKMYRAEHAEFRDALKVYNRDANIWLALESIIGESRTSRTLPCCSMFPVCKCNK